MLLGAATVALLLDALRRYTATSAIALAGVYSAYVAALVVLLPFVLQAGATAVLARRPPRQAFIVAGAIFVLAARGAPFAEDTASAIVVSGIACLAGATLLSLLVASRDSRGVSIAFDAIALGLVVDVGRRALLGTLDVAELPGSGSVVVAAVESALFLAVLLSARIDRRWASPVRTPLTLAVVPLAFTVAELIATNGWRTAAAAGLGLADTRGTGATATGTMAIAVGIAVGVLVQGTRARWLAAVTLLGGAAVVALRIPAVSLAGGALLACGLVLALRLLSSAHNDAALSTTRVAVLMALGWTASFAALLAYYVPYGFTPALWAAIAVVAGTALASRAHLSAPRTLRVASVAVIAISLATVIGAPESPAVETGSSLRLMTYNIHFGFDDRQTPSLDRIADTIAGESPDVVVLQEVMRGSSLAVQHDALGWLTGRLGMRYVFAPTIGDFFGNAVLSRIPIEAVDRMSFVRPTPLRHSPRGALLVRVAGVTVIVTHLDEYRDDESDAVRQGQVTAILERWGGIAAPLVVAGDLNALPDSRPLAVLRAAGFADLAAEAGPTIPAGTPLDRIDYVLAKGLTASSARVLPSTASDHRAVVVELVLPRR